MIIAKKHIGVAGRTYTPGEVIDGLTKEQRKRLLRMDAIRDTARDPIEPEPAADGLRFPGEDAAHMDGDAEATDDEDADDEADDEAESDDEEDAAEEFDMKDLDAMGSIVDDPEPEAEPEEKPARGGRKAKGGGAK